MTNRQRAVWGILIVMSLSLGGCFLDFRRDCRILEEKLEKAKTEELWSISQVYRMNGCTNGRPGTNEEPGRPASSTGPASPAP